MAKKKTTDEGGAQGPEWLAALETQVAAATERLGELRRDNDRLAARVEELEEALEDAVETARRAAGDDGGGETADDAAEAWRRERQQIRGRVERLTEVLEGLLDE